MWVKTDRSCDNITIRVDGVQYTLVSSQGGHTRLHHFQSADGTTSMYVHITPKKIWRAR